MLKSLVKEFRRVWLPGPAKTAQGAEQLRRSGNPEAALAMLARVAVPDAEVEVTRGLALRDLGDAKRAIAALRRSLSMRDPDAIVLNELGILLLVEGQIAEARSMFERAARIDPTMASALANLALVHVRTRHPELAVPLLEEAVRIAPGELTHRLNLFSALRDAGDLDSSEQCLDAAERRFPSSLEISFGRATLERESGRTEQAQSRLEGLLRDNPREIDAQRLLGMVLQDRGDYAGAKACFDKILEVAPGDHQTRFVRGLLRLLMGDFSVGWDDYAARFLTEESPDFGLPFPVWDGRPIEGTLLVYAEQGVGDEIMFASCLREASSRCGRCVLQCDPRLAPLFERSFPDVTVVGAPRTNGAWLARLPSIQAEVAAGSLAGFFRRESSSFEGRGPYLRASPDRVEYWRRKLRESGPGPYVGISWRGGIAKTRQRVRSIPADAWRPMLAGRTATWVALQYDVRDGESESLASASGASVWTWREALSDLDETAALVCALDHVVTVCNALVHLSGALGQDATVLVPRAPEWRYGANGERMPWYPGITLVRQAHGEDWGPALRVAAARVAALS